MLEQYVVKTESEGFSDITETVREALVKSGVKDGICVVYCPHTTAGITINENADPDVGHDILLGLSHAYPDSPQFCHAGGNSTAHLKASCIGSSVTVIIKGGQLVLGEWQGIYCCEFDGPRNRRFYVKIMEG
ncbi:MAG TPA: secondary thiamine-phosphate synthase enzyme YjbQ [Candidatus Limiplasma sp.]|nr:secondary thiamine-phosphate synthase enzyme YjbQ [Candidatus Limiplasma sp.]